MAHNDFRLQLVSNYIGLALIVISVKLDIWLIYSFQDLESYRLSKWKEEGGGG